MWQNLRKKLGRTEVLMGVDFNIAPGGFLTLAGSVGVREKALRCGLISGLDEVKRWENLDSMARNKDGRARRPSANIWAWCFKTMPYFRI